MEFNEEELLQIEKATSGLFRRKARRFIANAISSLRPHIDLAKSKSGVEREEILKVLLNQATGLRQEAVRQGASSCNDPGWAATATCESWLHELLSGTPSSISSVEQIVDRLERR
jgi:hypothetical protein